MHAPHSRQTPRTNQHSGFGLTEVLVAMAIGLIGMLAIMQAFSMNERYKENTVGTSGAQTNGSIALFTVERDVRMAGYGLASLPALGCGPVQYHFSGQYAGAGLPQLLLVPVLIEQGAGGGGSDVITTLSSSNDYRLMLATLNQDMPNTSPDIRVTSGVGFAVNDLAVAIQGATCALMQVTNIQDPASHYQRVGNGTYNPAAASALPGFTVGAQILSLGQPQLRRYALDNNNNLTVQDWNMRLTGAAPNVIVDEIVDLQAEYGLDDGGGGGVAGDNVIDTYTTVTPAAAAAWQQLLAVRIGVLARGAFERPDANGVCTVTTAANAPTWAGGAFNIPGGLPSCFRYRVFETTVPLRNMIWRSDR